MRNLLTFMEYAALAGALAVFGCHSSDRDPATGTVDLYMTDAPGEYLEVVVTIDAVSIKSSGGDWVELPLNTDIDVGGAVVDKDIPRGRLTIDLVQLGQGEPMRLALGRVPAGHLDQIRLHVVEDMVNGQRTPWVLEDIPEAMREFVKIPSGHQTGLKIVPRNVEVLADGLVAVTLDFDAQRSVIKLTDSGLGGPSRGFDFLLKPVIFVKDAESLVQPATTIAVGLNFPTGVDYLRRDEATASDDRIAVSNGGTASSAESSNASTVLTLDPSGYASGTPIDATATDGSVVRAVMTQPPLGLRRSEGLRGAGAFEAVAGEEVAHFTAGDPLTFTSDVIGGTLTAVEPVDFSGRTAYFLGRGTETLFFDPASGPAQPVGISGLADVTGLAFIPNVPEGMYGTLMVTDRGADPADPADDQILAQPLSALESGVTLPGPAIRHTAATLGFLNEPVGVVRSAAGGVYVAMRGNGFIHELGPDLALIRILDTGLGASSLNGIAVAGTPALAGFETSGEALLLANTLGLDDPAAGDPLDPAAAGGGTIEIVVP
ncbi:MAG: DUF4382 domain-containing protein [Planctomycetes bacterium]|nr:DUF4382 domain-containing protein [Planctomycetota bacterium]